MKRPWHVWTAFGLCLAVLLGAMGWVSLTALRSERAEAETRRQAAIEENVRLALWRMDSLLAPLIAQEAARAYFVYSAFYPAERAYDRMFSEIGRGEVLVPSPLLTASSSQVLLHFQFESDGRLASPQAPEGNMRDLAETGYKTHEQIDAAMAQLAEFRRKVSLAALNEHRPRQSLEPQDEMIVVQPPLDSQDPNWSATQQSARNAAEFSARKIIRDNMDRQAQMQSNDSALLTSSIVNATVMQPVWAAGELLLVRWVKADGREYVQGCWLDWGKIRPWLLASVNDLLPGAGLQPVRAEDGNGQARMLASLPVRILPGAVDPGPASGGSPVVFSLIIAWVCVLLAAGASAGLLRGAVALSERRGAFVSAVTHELRTPLTTFRLYSEMLAEGMVTDEAKRARYLETLRGEAGRLSHLVENVLAYARLERSRIGGRAEVLTVGKLLDRVQDRLAQHAQRSAMELVVEAGEAERAAQLKVDPSGVEQILFNLVDNACKYAASAARRVIHVQAELSGATVALRVCDHGPGIDPREAVALFRPFRKSARDAANSAPGVGLGLALSRQIARSMGGELTIDTCVSDGACLLLTLPALCRRKARPC